MSKLWLALAAVAIAGACHARTVRHVAAEVARVEAVRRGKIVDRVLLAGELHATAADELRVPRTEVWMLSIRWMAEDGSRVKAGDRVVELDNSQFTEKLEEKRLALTTAELTLADARALTATDIASKELELKQHQIELAKKTLEASVPADLLGARDAQDRQLKLREAQVAVDRATSALASLKSQSELDLRVKEIETEKAKTAIEAAEHATTELMLVAPRDGLVVVENHPWSGHKLHVGDQVPAGVAIASLPDEQQGMRVRADLSDVDDGRVKVGMTGTCTLDAYPSQPLACTVDQLTPVARPKTGQGSLRRVFTLELTLAASDAEHMRPGMSVEVELHASEVADAVIVPRGAILSVAANNGHAATTRVQLPGGQSRDVAIGPCDAQACAVQHGLAVGENVVVGGEP
jgi:HlyD family secretion protein